MDPAIRSLIEAIHRSEAKCVLAVTGGGATASALLLGVPGASRTILEVIVPYDDRALAAFLGRVPEQACSTATALAMASRARERGQWLAPDSAVVGIGCTASLATNRPKRGEHRCHVALVTDTHSVAYSLHLEKGHRDREGEEHIVDALLLNVLAEVVGIDKRIAVPLTNQEVIEISQTPMYAGLNRLVHSELTALSIERDGRLVENGTKPMALVPGSFNPVHAGHWGLATAAERRLGCHVSFELSLVNVDKPDLSSTEVRRRAAQFTWKAPLWLTRAPTFVEKARLFPAAIFVVGADTAARIVQARYYADDPERMCNALAEIGSLGNRFLVAGRDDAAGRFLGLEQLSIPPVFKQLFEAIPEGSFRVALSSTELRKRQA